MVNDDTPTPLTRFADLSGSNPVEVAILWAVLKRMFVNMAPKYAKKEDMPLISGAKFGTVCTAKGSFRHDGNVVMVRVLVVDVDDWPFPIEEAMERLRLAGVAAVLFTTPGHMVAKKNGLACPRFRVLLPLSQPLDHAGMTMAMNRVNELLDGHVAPESWKPAQSYYIGRLLVGEWFTDSCEGEFIDLAAHIAERPSSQPIPLKAFVQLGAPAVAPAQAPASGGAGGGAFSFPTAPSAAPTGRGRPNKHTGYMIGRMKAKGLFLSLQADGTVWMKCPFCHLHSTKDTPGDCVWFPPHTLGYSRGHFKCLHANHGGRTLTDQDFLDALDIPPATPANQATGRVNDFIAVRMTDKYLHLPTMTEWSRTAVDAHVPRGEWPIGQNNEQMSPASWLAYTEGQPAITQYAWLPGQPTPVIFDSVVQDGQLVPSVGNNILNMWRPLVLPPLRGGIFDAEPWLEHGRRLYGDEFHHIVRYLAFALQNPGVKINHGLVFTGPTRIGKDTILKAIAWFLAKSGNWKETTPAGVLGQFNDFVMTMGLRINEIEAVVDPRGRSSYLLMYDHLKIILAAPPELLPVNRKGLPVLHVPNVCFVVITSNSVETVLNLIPEDQRAYVVSTNLQRRDMPDDYHAKLHAWHDAGGNEAVIHYLMSLDVSDFDPKAPPPMTSAKRTVIAAAGDPLAATMADLLDAMARPPVLAVRELEHLANTHRIDFEGLPPTAPKYRNRLTQWLAESGYVRFPNPGASDGYFKINGKRSAVFVQAEHVTNALAIISTHYDLKI